jgi:hypothetical protein
MVPQAREENDHEPRGPAPYSCTFLKRPPANRDLTPDSLGITVRTKTGED